MFLIFLVFGCTGGPGGEVAPPAAPSLAPAATPDAGHVREHMHRHLERATVAVESLVHGELEAAHAQLAWLGDHDPPAGLPEGSEPFLARMRSTAKAAAAAPDAPTVAAGLAELAVACGDCHRAVGATPVVRLGAPPPPSGRLFAHMARHQWGVSALWSALALSSGEVWSAGAAALSDEALPEGAFEVPGLSREAWGAAHALHARARQAAGETAVADRAASLAAIVSACFGCHTELRGE